jgi:LysM repeat protein
MLRLQRVVLAACIGIGLTTGAVIDPVAAAPSTPVSSGATYTVRAGDYLSGIAVKLNVSLKDLLQTNGLTVTSLILPGQQLRVPSKGTSTAAAPAKTTAVAVQQAPATTYTVVSGDYLTGIAAKLKVSTTALLTANNLKLNSLIWPGMQLKVPKGGVVPTSSAGTAPTTSSAPKPAAPAAAAYTVVRNDSLSGIAQKLGVKLTSLLTTNQMTVSSMIYPGMSLKVPAGGKAPATTAAPSTTTPSTTPTTSAPAPKPATGPVPAKVQTVLAFARAQLGKPYKFNTAGPNSYDCSGLTLAAYATVGIDLPHYSGAQMAFGTVVDWTTEAIRPGDLVFLETAVGSGVIGHVGIATSQNTWIQAPRTGDVIREGSFTTTRVVGVRRLVAD